MHLTNTSKQYGVLTRVTHWAVALLIIGLVALGYWMVDLGYYDPWYLRALDLHKAFGIVALAFALAKVALVLSSVRVAYQASLSGFETAAAWVVHHLLYIAMLLVPLSGYLISTSAGDSVSVFGWFQVPALLPVSDEVRDVAIAVHYWAAYGVAALACVHAGAALKHQFIDGKSTLRRMLW